MILYVVSGCCYQTKCTVAPVSQLETNSNEELYVVFDQSQQIEQSSPLKNF